MAAFLIPLVAAILPFALWPVELILPFPHVVEELAKAGLVLAALGEERRGVAFALILASGVAFSLSETVLYSLNLLAVGDGGTFVTRLALTTALHTGTIVVMWSIAQFDRRLLGLGLIIAIALHAWYNAAIGLAG